MKKSVDPNRLGKLSRIMIEPTNVCNFRCLVCPTGQGYDKRPKGNLKFGQFRKIIEPVENSLKEVNLWGFGEPFLNPEIMKIVGYLGEKNVSVQIHTNGSVLTKKIMDQFKKNHRVMVSFSIDGLTQKTYGHYRQGGDLKKVMANLSYLTALKRKHNLFNLQTTWQFLITKMNEHEVNQVEETARKIGVDRLRLKTIRVNEGHPAYRDLIPANSDYQREGNKISKGKKCFFLSPGIPTVFWDGSVVPCCRIYSSDLVMGNALKESVIDIWNSRQYRKFRNDYKKGINSFCNEKCTPKRELRVYIKEIKFSHEK